MTFLTEVWQFVHYLSLAERMSGHLWLPPSDLPFMGFLCFPLPHLLQAQDFSKKYKKRMRDEGEGRTGRVSKTS